MIALTLEDGRLVDTSESNRVILDVNLRLNKIGGGGKLLAHALMTNPTVRIIDLGLNPMGGNGARFLSIALRSKDALKDLRL